jgi:hypothetical protein
MQLDVSTSQRKIVKEITTNAKAEGPAGPPALVGF